MTDLSMPTSTRTIQRRLPELCTALGQRPETFRQMRQRVRLWQAVSAMSNPKSTTERVGKALGFANPTGFCRALRNYGLPSPGAVKRHFL